MEALSVLMNFDDQMGELYLPSGRLRPGRPVGTRGGCGGGWGPCACPVGNAIRPGSVRPDGRTPTRTSTRPPHPPNPTPCPYRTRAGVSRHSPVGRQTSSGRGQAFPVIPPLVGKHYQDEGRRFPSFPRWSANIIKAGVDVSRDSPIRLAKFIKAGVDVSRHSPVRSANIIRAGVDVSRDSPIRLAKFIRAGRRSFAISCLPYS